MEDITPAKMIVSQIDSLFVFRVSGDKEDIEELVFNLNDVYKIDSYLNEDGNIEVHGTSESEANESIKTLVKETNRINGVV